MTFPFVVFLLSFLVLLWSGKFLPQAIGGISKVLRLSHFITAFFLVAFATSIPELFIGISSALQGASAISLGNLMGANFANLTLVIGLSVLFAGTIKGDGKISSQNFWLIFLIALLPILLATDGVISRGDGTVLLTAFGLYVLKIFRDRQYFHPELEKQKPKGIEPITKVLHHLARFAVGALLLLISSFFLIWSGKTLAIQYLGDNFLVFGVLFVALGTTLPELVFGIRSSLGGNGQLMLGNAVGSVAFNAAAIVGIVSLIHPIQVDITGKFMIIAAFLFLAFVLFHLFVYTQHSISRKEGFILVLLYVAFFSVTVYDCLECIVLRTG